MNDDEKNIVINQALKYLEGMSLREIAKGDQQSHVTVRDNLKVKLKVVDEQLYSSVLEKLDCNVASKNEKSIKNPEVIKRILNAYKKCVEDNKTVLEIASELGSTEFTIYRDLTRRLQFLHQIDPLIVTEEMLENVAMALDNRKRENLSYEKKIENSFDMRYLAKMYPTFDKRIMFMSKCALTFGLRLDALSELMGIEKDQLYNSFLGVTKTSDSLYFLFNHGFRNQDKAVADFKKFFVRLTNAYKTGDKEKIVLVLEKISDKDIKEFKQAHENGKRITEEDVVALIKWQLKYGVSSKTVALTFNLSLGNYIKRVASLEDKYPSLVSNYYYVEDYYQREARNGVFYG